MRSWVGKYVAAVGCVHGALGVVAFSDAFAQVFREGLFNTINGEPELEFPFWFVVTGVFWVLVGLLISDIEQSGRALPRFVGWFLLGSAVVGVAIMPLSGWWLFLVPGVALVRRGAAKPMVNAR